VGHARRLNAQKRGWMLDVAASKALTATFAPDDDHAAGRDETSASEKGVVDEHGFAAVVQILSYAACEILNCCADAGAAVPAAVTEDLLRCVTRQRQK